MTIQAKERINIDGKQYKLLSRPFEPFLEALNVELLPINSACWRGYFGAWGTIKNVLYLTDIKMCYRPEDEYKLAPLKIDGVIHQATWYTGELIIALVEPTWYNPSCVPVYTNEMHLTVENGLIVNHNIVENEVPEIEDDGLPF